MIGVKVYEEVQKLFCLDRVMSNAIKGKKVMIITANDVIFEIIKRIILPSFFFFFSFRSKTHLCLKLRDPSIQSPQLLGRTDTTHAESISHCIH